MGRNDLHAAMHGSSMHKMRPWHASKPFVELKRKPKQVNSRSWEAFKPSAPFLPAADLLKALKSLQIGLRLDAPPQPSCGAIPGGGTCDLRRASPSNFCILIPRRVQGTSADRSESQSASTLNRPGRWWTMSCGTSRTSNLSASSAPTQFTVGEGLDSFCAMANSAVEPDLTKSGTPRRPVFHILTAKSTAQASKAPWDDASPNSSANQSASSLRTGASIAAQGTSSPFAKLT